MPRKTTDEQLADNQAKQKQLKAQAAALEARKRAEDRKLDARRKIVVGGAALAHAAHDPEWKARLREVLSRGVTRDIDKAVISDLLADRLAGEPQAGEPHRAQPAAKPSPKNSGPR